MPPNPANVGWLLFGYSIVFGTGVTAWSFILPHIHLQNAMRITLGAMLPVCAGLYVLNHSGNQSSAVRLSIGGLTALLIMVESGFTPAALVWLAGTLPIQSGHGHLLCLAERRSHRRVASRRTSGRALFD